MDDGTHAHVDGEVQFTGTPTLVCREALCSWDVDRQKQNLSYLEAVDPDYFAFLARTLEPILGTDDDMRAAVALRSAYFHGLETFFALLMAFLQSPLTMYVWMLRYRPDELHKLVQGVNERKRIPNAHQLQHTTWKHLVEAFYPEHEAGGVLVQAHDRMERLWTRFAHDFTNAKHVAEYNSIKHGFRQRAGGYTLRIAAEQSPGKLAEGAVFHTLSESVHGSEIRTTKWLSKRNLHIQPIKHNLNWTPSAMVEGLALISDSLTHLTTVARYHDGFVGELMLKIPGEEQVERYIRHSNQRAAMDFNHVIAEDEIRDISRNDVIAQVEEYTGHTS